MSFQNLFDAIFNVQHVYVVYATILQVASPQVEEVISSSNTEEQTVMTPPAQNFDTDKPTVHLIEDDEDIEEEEEDDDDDIEIIPQRDQGKQVEDLDDATEEEEEEEDIGVKPASQFNDDEDEDEEPIEKGIRTPRFHDEDDDDE